MPFVSLQEQYNSRTVAATAAAAAASSGSNKDGAFGIGEEEGTVDGASPSTSLSSSSSSSSPLLVHYQPPNQEDPTLTVKDDLGNDIPLSELDIGEYTNMMSFWECLKQGLDAFYALGYNDAISNLPRGGSLYQQQQQLLIDTGLMQYL